MEKKEELDALEDAQRWLKTAELTGKSGNYNIGLYSIEMSVEIALKAVLISLQVNYPKTHDIIAILVNAVKEKKGHVPQEFIQQEPFIIRTFEELLKMRGPAGYTFSSNIKIERLKEDFDVYLSNAITIINICKKTVEHISR